MLPRVFLNCWRKDHNCDKEAAVLSWGRGLFRPRRAPGWAGGKVAAVAHEHDGKGEPLGDKLNTKAGATLSQLRKLTEWVRWRGNSTGLGAGNRFEPSSLGNHSSTLTFCFLICDVATDPSLLRKLSL